jgi:uncharacterized membrane protein
LSPANRTVFDYIALVFKGILMGAANKVPGISGGVIAFVGGFYEEFIFSLNRFNIQSFRLLITLRWRSFFTYVNGGFLTLLISGMLISYFSVAKVLDYLISNYELYVWSTFLGMIVGSVYYLEKQFGAWDHKSRLSAFLGLAAGLSLSLIPQMPANDNLYYVFFCGVISVAGMTLPGLSGSFLLILLGNYVLLLVDAVNALYDTFIFILRGDYSFASNPEHLRLLKVLVVFTLGSITGLVSLSHLLAYVLKKFKSITIAVLIGFVAGSLMVIWPWKKTNYNATASSNPQSVENYWPDFGQKENIAALGYIALGIIIVLAIDLYGRKRKRKGNLRLNR